METFIFWHRRDLRINDNAGLYKALTSKGKVQPVFIFDSNILQHLSSNDQRVLFIYQQIITLKESYQAHGADLIIRFGDPKAMIPFLVEELNATAVFTNRDYEPYAQERDSYLYNLLKDKNVSFTGAKDHVVFEKNEVLKNDGLPYTIFTPYMRKWKETLNDFYLKAYPTEKYFSNLKQTTNKTSLPTLEAMGFNGKQTVDFPNNTTPLSIIANYHETRDIPSVNGTSRLSVHLRFGTISIRSLAKQAMKTNEKFFNELIWRDFYQMIMVHFPHSLTGAFRKEYDHIIWEFNESQFEAWKSGNTGYPLVDAGMRELNATGHMHNRVRMVVASFFTKHLLHDWRLGERYFAEKLLDFELASNIGGWQWAAGCGCDAAPYFRVFNPTSQQEKFDPQFTYIKKWVPEFGTSAYAQPIVEHKWARERVLARYKEALKPA